LSNLEIQASAAISSKLPQSIRRLIESAVHRVDPDKILLYGSRARGDAREGSDYDLAFMFPRDCRAKWVRFVVDLDDAPITLWPVDLLDWSEASESLRDRIRREGITLYERSSGS
jgi:predicted nucleotidyltransferase